ncbi:MAG: PD-(D/E)XK nuclease family protein [Clostridia bacterium]|nr:PD-(D/E)XK nuclease family protein [Clostridia bacterium]
MLTLLCGLPGSGKTEACIARARAALSAAPGKEKRIYFICPEQETVSAEGRILSSLPPHAPLFVEVDNFSRLANAVFRSVGGVARTHAGKNLKRAVMWRVLQNLSLPDKTSPERVKERLGVVGEFIDSAVSPDKLSAAARSLSGDGRLSSLLEEYALILAAYTALMEEAGGDPGHDGDILISVLKTHDFFCGCEIYLDGFTSFTGQEYAIIERLLAQADSVTVTLGGSPRGGGIWLAEIRDTAARLEAIAERLSVPVLVETLGENRRTDNPVLRRLSSSLWNAGREAASPDDPGEALRLVRAGDELAEAEFLAADLARRIREDGCRYADFAVVVRSLDAWESILEPALREHGIPAFFAHGSKLDDRPAVRFFLSACACAARGFRPEDVKALLKSGCLPLSDDDCDLYLRYAKTWSLTRRDLLSGVPFTMSVNGFEGDGRDPYAAETLARINGVRDCLFSLLAPFDAALRRENLTVKEAAEAAFALLSSAGVREKMEAEAARLRAAGETRAANEEAGVWNALLSALDTAVRAAGEETVDARGFSDLMRLLLSDSDLSAIPTSSDAVTVGSADTLRASGVRHVYLLGVREGEFPAAVSVKGFFSEREKRLLADAGIELTRDAAILTAREFYFFSRALSLASESVTMVCHLTVSRDGSAEREAASFLRTKRLFPAVRYLVYDPASAAFLSDRRSAENYLLLAGDGAPEAAAVRAALKKTGAPVPEPEKTPDAVLAPSTREACFARDLTLSQSQLESYANCHFSYLLRYLSKVKEDARPDLGANHAGTYVHAVLEKLVPSLSEGKVREAEISDEVRRLGQEQFERLCPPERRDDPLLKMKFTRLTEGVAPVARQLARELSASAFTTFGTEIRFGGDGESPSPAVLPLSGGRRAILSGTVDRADVLADGAGNVYVRVIDYKTGQKTFTLSALDRGRSLQLPLYLFALCDEKNADLFCRAGKSEGGKVLPAGMLYCIAKPPEKKAACAPSDDEYETIEREEVALYGVVLAEETVQQALDPAFFSLFSEEERKGKRSDPKNRKRLTLSAPELDELRHAVWGKITDMAENLLTGDVRAASDGPEGPECDFCPYGPVCRLPLTEREQSKTEEKTDREEESHD